jgi:hypothetical protein
MNPTVIRGLKTGATLAAATTATMLISSTFKSKSPWAGLNAMATAVGVGGRRPSKSFGPVATPAGLGVLVGGMLVWGLGYEAALAATGRRSSLFTGALSALGGYAFDRLILPDHLVPNFQKTMGTLGTLAKYTALGLASAMSSRAADQVGSPTAERGQGTEQTGEAGSTGADVGQTSPGAEGVDVAPDAGIAG